MFDFIYVTFFFLMLAEMVLFIFLNLPFPKTWKAGIIEGLAGSPTAKSLFKVQLVLCLLVLLFYVDLGRSEKLFQGEKNKLRSKTNMGAGIYCSMEVVKLLVRAAPRKTFLSDN